MNSPVAGGIAVLAVALVVALLVLVSQARARNAYFDSLERLRRDPRNAALLEATLELGRAYARHIGRFANRRPGIVDEVALISEINAFCAIPKAGGRPGAEGAVEARLAQLDALHAKQLITDHEYQSTRQRIMDETSH